MIAVLIKTHFIDAALLEQLRTMRRALLGQPQVELVLGVDAAAVPAAALGAVEAALPGLRLHGFHRDRYAAHGLRPHAFLAEMGAPLDWYHSDYSLIDFHLHHPQRYTALWQIEYDVSLRRGSWDFLGRDLPFDLLVPGRKIRERGLRALVDSARARPPCQRVPRRRERLLRGQCAVGPGVCSRHARRSAFRHRRGRGRNTS